MTEKTKRQVQEAGKLISAGKPGAAEEILKRLVKEDPKRTAVLAVLGHAYWEQGRLVEAVETFRRAIEQSPKLEAISLGLFHCLWTLERYDEALEEIKRFQTVSHSQDYTDIIDEINRKY